MKGRRFRAKGIAALVAALSVNAVSAEPLAVDASPDARFVAEQLLFSDDFAGGMEQWQPELKNGGDVHARDGVLTIDVPGGCTVWFKSPLSGPVLIQYRATVVGAGGANDRVSDLNCFWMARDSRAPDDIFAVARGGKFSEYDALLCYYVGLGGNGNTTSRFRRYVGEMNNRPLLPEHDLRATPDLLTPNAEQKISLIAAGSTVEFYRGERRMFTFTDPQAYTRGWFGFRTVGSHLEMSGFRVYRLRPAGQTGE